MSPVRIKKPVKVCLLSDIHANLPELPEADLVLLGGDICPDGGLMVQAKWLDNEFRAWLGQIKGQVIGVAGNHDFVFEQAPGLVPKLPWTYLQDSAVEVLGWKIYGSPWQLRFFDWAFNLDEWDLKKKWDLIPGDTDIFLLHSPPYGFGDGAPRPQGGVDHVGSPSLLERIKLVKPKLVVFGHIHPGRGVFHLDETTLVNASLVNNRYQPVYAPVVMDLL